MPLTNQSLRIVLSFNVDRSFLVHVIVCGDQMHRALNTRLVVIELLSSLVLRAFVVDCLDERTSFNPAEHIVKVMVMITISTCSFWFVNHPMLHCFAEKFNVLICNDVVMSFDCVHGSRITD